MELHLHTFNLSLRHTFTISRGSRNIQPTLIVELRDGSFSGFGEATSNPYYEVSTEGMLQKLEEFRHLIETHRLDTPEKFWSFLHPYLQQHPFIHCALDEAAHDLYAKKQGLPLYKTWGLSLNNLPSTNYTIGIDTIEKMLARMQEIEWPIYKIKLGTPDDIQIIKTLRKHTDAIFRIDANCAWTVKETIANSIELKKLGVEFIEQPLPAEDWEGMKEVYQYSVLPLIADESCRVETDVKKCFGHFHGINIKLMKCGGLTPALRMIREARTLNMQVMVGCMTESTVGVSAIAHLLPLLDYVDMDGPLLLKEDIATGITIKRGKVFFPDASGTGVKLIRRNEQ